MNSEFDNNNNNQFIVSRELLRLFQWLFDYEQETLKKLIIKAMKNGLQAELHQNSVQPENNEELQQTIIDFFALLETLVLESLHEREVNNVVNRSLIPAIDRIDTAACDNATLAMSVAKATAAHGKHSAEDLKKILCKELLKRWKPAKKPSIN